MPRVQVANKLHEGRARASHIVCMPVYRPSSSHTAMGEGSFTLATMLCIHLVYIHARFCKDTQIPTGLIITNPEPLKYKCTTASVTPS